MKKREGCGCQPSSDAGLAVDFCPLHEAAPELLTALEALLNTLAAGAGAEISIRHSVFGKAYSIARAAIAKARGQEVRA